MKMTSNVFDTAVNILAYKDRTSKELIDKLKQKGYETDDILLAVAKLQEYGYVDDYRYARAYIHDYSGKKGRKLLLRDLSIKGIDKDTADAICEELLPDEEGIIDYTISRRFSSADFTNEKEINRIIAYFVRRGYSYNKISKIVAKYRKLD